VTAEVIPDNLIMINIDKRVIHDKLSLTVIYYNCLSCGRMFVVGWAEFDWVMGCGLDWYVSPKFLLCDGLGWVGSVVWWVKLG